jgi:hypothetical protein
VRIAACVIGLSGSMVLSEITNLGSLSGGANHVCVYKKNSHLVVQIKQPVDRAQNNARSPNATDDNSLDLLRPEDFFKSVAVAGVVPGLPQDNVSNVLLDLEVGVDCRGIVVFGCDAFDELCEAGVGFELGFELVAEINAREDRKGCRFHVVHGVDPLGCVLDECAALRCGGDGSHNCIDEVEVEDGVVLAEGHWLICDLLGECRGSENGEDG